MSEMLDTVMQLRLERAEARDERDAAQAECARLQDELDRVKAEKAALEATIARVRALTATTITPRYRGTRIDTPVTIGVKEIVTALGEDWCSACEMPRSQCTTQAPPRSVEAPQAASLGEASYLRESDECSVCGVSITRHPEFACTPRVASEADVERVAHHQ